MRPLSRPRSRALRRAALLGAILCAAAWIAACGDTRADPAPNVLIVVMDTTRADRCSFNGYDRPTTPRLEQFARDAVVYSDAWSPASWTGPAHASLFTGLRPDHHGFHNAGTAQFDAAHATLAEVLRKQGWATGCFTNNPWVSKEFGLTQGFDLDVAFFRDANRPTPWARETHRQAAGWMEARAREGKPFFAFVNDMEPHAPYDPPTEFARRLLRGSPDPDLVDAVRQIAPPRTAALSLSSPGLTAPTLAILSDLYDAEIACLDAEIGTLLDRMRKSGLLDQTLVVVVGDHGEGLGDHGWLEHAVFLHRELLRVPLIVRYPGKFDGGRRHEGLVLLEDVAPTILEICGVAPPRELDGVSLLAEPSQRVSLAFDAPYPTIAAEVRRLAPTVDVEPVLRHRRSVYDGALHLITDSTGGQSLFDVANDPLEQNDLAPLGGPALERLRGILERAFPR